MTDTTSSSRQQASVWLSRKKVASVGLGMAALLFGSVGLYALTQSRVWGDEVRSGKPLNTTVHNVDELAAALARAGNNSVIKLAPGDYPVVDIKNIHAAGTITITSAQPDHPARLFRMTVNKSSGLVFSHLEFAPPEGSVRDLPFRFHNMDRLTLDHLYVHGPDNPGMPMEIPGLMLRNSQNVTLSHSRFTRLLHGVNVLEVKGLQVIANDFWNMRSDGVRGGGISDALYAHNICTNFNPVTTDHPDCIQLWSTNAKEPGRNIIIRDNLFVRGKGSPIQGIFIRDTFSKMPFENVEVSDNLIIGSLFNGIAIGGLIGGKLLRNNILALNGQKSWLRLQGGRQVELRDNSAPKVLISECSDLKESGNHFNQGFTGNYRKALVQWLDAKPERSRKDSALLQELVANAS